MLLILIISFSGIPVAIYSTIRSFIGSGRGGGIAIVPQIPYITSQITRIIKNTKIEILCTIFALLE